MLKRVSFEECLRPILSSEPNAITRRLPKRSVIYAPGSRDDQVYFVAAGLVKTVMHSQAGKECLLNVYTPNDIFGESCFSEATRSETAIAMSDTVLKQVPCRRFLSLINETGLAGDFVYYLARRLAEQQQAITDFATVNCEQRLAAALLRLWQKAGTPESSCLMQRISHQELSQIVGTTRPRISEFLHRFRMLGLIEVTAGSRICIRERRLREYLEMTQNELPLEARAS